MLEFDDETTRLLEETYQGADIRRRRRASFDALSPRTGQHILDLGCGNGLLTQDLARAVGETGHVTGIDPSPAMLSAARKRLSGRTNVTLLEGVAEALPCDDTSLDGALSLQVFEYFDDCAPALSELHRVLRPGARLVIGDMHFGTLVWHSDAPDRMAELLEAYEKHVANPALPQTLPDQLATAGFDVAAMTPVVFSDRHLAADGLARMMLELVPAYTVGAGLVSADVANAWRAEQFDLARHGRFFFSLNHYVCTATRR